MTVNILGTVYAVIVKKYDEDEAFRLQEIDAYCDDWIKEIVICDFATHPGWENEPAATAAIAQKEALRHEIVHAFFSESGLGDSSVRFCGAYSKNEELVDWIALQGPKIYAAWQSVGAV